MAYNWLLPERKKDETQTEKTLNNLLDRAMKGYQRNQGIDSILDVARDTLLDKVIKKRENQFRQAEQKLGILAQSRALGLTPTQALNDDFLEEEEGLNAEHVLLARKSINTLSQTPKAFSGEKKLSNTFSKLISALKNAR